MEHEPFDLESVYDAEIAPLMTKIIAICHEHKLPMFATFLFANDPEGDDGLCTTNLMFKERPIPDELLELVNLVGMGARRPALKLTVRDKNGQITDKPVIIP